jgi:excisionase family DNA binding protein
MTTSVAAPVTDRIWFDTAQAAEYASFSTKTIVRALQAGELRGQQLKDRGRWRIHRDWLDAWLSGGAA